MKKILIATGIMMTWATFASARSFDYYEAQETTERMMNEMIELAGSAAHEANAALYERDFQRAQSFRNIESCARQINVKLGQFILNPLRRHDHPNQIMHAYGNLSRDFSGLEQFLAAVFLPQNMRWTKRRINFISFQMDKIFGGDHEGPIGHGYFAARCEVVLETRFGHDLKRYSFEAQSRASYLAVQESTQLNYNECSKDQRNRPLLTKCTVVPGCQAYRTR